MYRRAPNVHAVGGLRLVVLRECDLNGLLVDCGWNITLHSAATYVHVHWLSWLKYDHIRSQLAVQCPQTVFLSVNQHTRL